MQSDETVIPRPAGHVTLIRGDNYTALTSHVTLILEDNYTALASFVTIILGDGCTALPADSSMTSTDCSLRYQSRREVRRVRMTIFGTYLLCTSQVSLVD